MLEKSISKLTVTFDFGVFVQKPLDLLI